MTKETYIQIRNTVKEQIKLLASIQKHNKLTLRHNQSPKNPNKKLYKNAQGVEVEWYTYDAQYKIPLMGQKLDEIHRFYNKLRNRPPHNGGIGDNYYKKILDKYIKEAA